MAYSFNTDRRFTVNSGQETTVSANSWFSIWSGSIPSDKELVLYTTAIYPASSTVYVELANDDNNNTLVSKNDKYNFDSSEIFRGGSGNTMEFRVRNKGSSSVSDIHGWAMFEIV